LTLKEVDELLDRLSEVTKEEDQYEVWKRCTGDDMKFLWKLIDHDLRINIGSKYVLTALHPDAFEGFLSFFNFYFFQRKMS
jgi:DNA ligase-3